MLHRLSWLYRLKILKEKGVDGRVSSYVDDQSVLEGANYFAQRSRTLNCSIGLFSYVNYDAVVSNADIGRYSCIGPFALVGGIGQHPINRRSTHRMFYSSQSVASWTGFANGDGFSESARTYVGSDVWIGLRAVVMDGVSIGDGAIVAAGAVVTRDVEPYSIVGGVPAKLIKKRFKDDVIDELLKEKWWEKDVASVQEMARCGQFSSTYAPSQR